MAHGELHSSPKGDQSNTVWHFNDGFVQMNASRWREEQSGSPGAGTTRPPGPKRRLRSPPLELLREAQTPRRPSPFRSPSDAPRCGGAAFTR